MKFSDNPRMAVAEKMVEEAEALGLPSELFVAGLSLLIFLLLIFPNPKQWLKPENWKRTSFHIALICFAGAVINLVVFLVR